MAKRDPAGHVRQLEVGTAVIPTAAAEGVQVYPRQNDFDFAQGQFLTWAQLMEGEALRALARLVTGR